MNHQRGVWEYNNDKSFAENGTIALMCPECLNVIRISVAHDNTTEDILDKLDYFSTSVSYHGACKRCGEHSLQIPLDINIAQIVEVLNSKGYYTAFSCEGHIEKDAYETTLYTFSHPYIYFYLWNDFNILKEHPLPETWSIDNKNIQNEIFQIYDNIIDNIPEDISCIDDEDKFIEWIYNNWNQQKRLEDIYIANLII